MYQSSPAYSIPHEKSRSKEKGKEEVPPPNKYIINPKHIGKRCPAWKIGTAKRNNPNSDTRQPGPFDYSANKDAVLVKAPKFPMGQKLKKERLSVGPGPASYEIHTDNVLRKTPMPIFPKDSRRTLMEKKGPGPADYTPWMEFGRTNTSVFSKAQRFKTEDSIRQPNSTFLHEYIHYQRSVKIDSVSARSPTYKFGTEKRDPFDNSNQFLPGPNKYDVKMSSVLRKTEGGTMCRDRRRINSEARERTTSPGPGDYNINVADITPAFMIPKSPRIMVMASARVPGPADYNPKVEAVLPKGPRSIFPRSVKTTQASQSPDPCSYNLRTEHSRGISFGKQKRHDLARRDVPAPNAYNIPNSFGVVAPYEKSRISTK